MPVGAGYYSIRSFTVESVSMGPASEGAPVGGHMKCFSIVMSLCEEYSAIY